MTYGDMLNKLSKSPAIELGFDFEPILIVYI